MISFNLSKTDMVRETGQLSSWPMLVAGHCFFRVTVNGCDTRSGLLYLKFKLLTNQKSASNKMSPLI